MNDRGVGKRDTVIKDSDRRTGPTLAIIAVFINLLTIPMGIALWETVFVEGNKAAAFGFVFPLIGLAALGWAVLKILRLLIHGTSTFEIAGGRGVIGNTLKGTVRNRRKSRPLKSQVAKLRCKRKVSSGSGDSSSTKVTTLWEGRQDLCQGRSSLCDGVPVEIEIPAFLPESDDSNSNSIVRWELLIEAPEKPISFKAQFTVPVCRA